MPARSTSRRAEATNERPQDIQVDAAQEIPGTLPVLPLRDTVVFPDTMIPLTIGQERSIKLIDDVLAGDRLLALVTSKDAEVEVPGPELLHPIGTVGLAHKMIKLPDGTMRILVQGLQRVHIDKYVQEEPYLEADITKVEDVVDESKEIDALRASLLSVFSKIVALVPYLPEELEMAAANVEDPGPLAFLIASTMRIKAEDKQALLEESDVEKRMRRLIGILTRELDVLELGSKIQSDVRSEIDKGQREYFLRQQMRAIQQELGETNDQEAEITELRQKVDELKLPEEADKAARRELDRLANISPQSAEYPVIRTYLDWIVTLPWTVSSDDNLDIRTRARSSTATTTTSRRSRTASSSSSRCASSRPTCTGRSSASSARPASARRASATASPRPWAASSSASASAACATRPRSAGIAARTWGRCPASSSAPCATPAPTTRCS